MRLDMRKQQIFAALSGRDQIVLDELATSTRLSRALCARELKRLGWRKAVGADHYRRPSA